MVRGYNIMVGYLDDPEQTAEAIDADGWLHTGDIGVMDADGYIDITDRKKDMFINGGFNVYPAEIEAAMLTHPDIGQVARWWACPTSVWARSGARSSFRPRATTPDTDEIIGVVSQRDGELQGAPADRGG